MIRYLALASAIVAIAIVAILALGRATAMRETAYASQRATPGPPREDGVGSSTPAPLAGDAPWALSALPDCFRQVHAVRGPRAFVNAHLARIAPPRATWRRIVAGRLATADCVVTIAGRTALVTRGDTRLTIPADARFSIADGRLILDRYANGGEDVRVYALRDGKAPAFDN